MIISHNNNIVKVVEVVKAIEAIKAIKAVEVVTKEHSVEMPDTEMLDTEV